MVIAPRADEAGHRELGRIELGHEAEGLLGLGIGGAVEEEAERRDLVRQRDEAPVLAAVAEPPPEAEAEEGQELRRGTAPTVARCRGATRIVASASWITAGPAIVAPCPSDSRR